ncbi:hypothetical protein RRG08_044277 [Elysia crispata]|uniref:Uncharacterized protein n=1 Tax=Elysia crispata TaxID=231223 RepID=A0AAE1A5B4_9GAST|nr:hypothetical protein RRG08_044277 [Elysia crispata]
MADLHTHLFYNHTSTHLTSTPPHTLHPHLHTPYIHPPHTLHPHLHTPYIHTSTHLTSTPPHTLHPHLHTPYIHTSRGHPRETPQFEKTK